MMEDLMRDLQVLWKADSLIGRIWLNVLARRFALTVFAALIAAFALGMANVAGFIGFEAAYGPVWSAAIVAVVDVVLAALVLALASSAKPGEELELALEVRKMAMASLQSDSAEAWLVVEQLSRDIRQTRESLAGLVQNPLGAATERLLVPAALSVLKGLRAKATEA
jgi:hypothetical protein